MPDIESIIAGAVADAGIGESNGTDASADSGSDAAATAAVGTEAAGGVGPDMSMVSGNTVAETTGAGTTTTAPVVEPDELDKELEALGIKPVESQRENRIPYKRVKKIVESARKKLADTHAATLKEREDRLTAAEQKTAYMDSVDKMIAEDADRYIGMLAVLHPDKYGKYVGRQPEATKPAAEAKVTEDPQPEPDGQYADGSKGYTPEGLQKLMDWRDRQTERRIKSEYDKRLAPFETERKQAQINAEIAPKVRNQVAEASKTWGKLFDDDYAKNDKSEILAVLRANDGQQGRPYLSFEGAVARVLTPRMQTDRNTMRESLLAEINARPAAATRTPAAAAAVVTPTGPRSMEDVIRESIAASGLK